RRGGGVFRLPPIGSGTRLQNYFDCNHNSTPDVSETLLGGELGAEGDPLNGMADDTPSAPAPDTQAPPDAADGGTNPFADPATIAATSQPRAPAEDRAPPPDALMTGIRQAVENPATDTPAPAADTPVDPADAAAPTAADAGA